MCTCKLRQNSCLHIAVVCVAHVRLCLVFSFFILFFASRGLVPRFLSMLSPLLSPSAVSSVVPLAPCSASASAASVRPPNQPAVDGGASVFLKKKSTFEKKKKLE